MVKKLLLFMILPMLLFSQQMNHSWGTNLAGETLSGLNYITVTDGGTNAIYVDLNDWYPIDISPLFSDDSVVNISSDRMYLGTFYTNFDTKGAAPTADSVYFYIKVYPGIYTTTSKSLASAVWGSAITLETVAETGDYFAINNVYLHASKYKHFPPEVIKLSIDNHADISAVGSDDSIKVDWNFTYPAIYHEHEVQK